MMQAVANAIAERISSISESSTMKVAADAGKLRAEGVDVVDFGAGEPDFPTPDNIKQAAIRALEAITKPSTVVIHTDSKYVMDGITQWLPRWKKNGWKTSDKKPVKNEDLWRALEAECARHQVTWRWVRGHAGHAENERVDVLARTEAEKFRTGSIPP